MNGREDLKNKINFWARKDFIRNFFSLTVFQVIELIIPLLTIPVIIDRVGPQKFGLLSFALVFAVFFQLIINFGFNTISVREISIYKDDFLKLKKIHNDTINSKFILSLICFIVFSLIVYSFEKFNTTPEIYLFTLLSLVGQSLIPIWFFQGLQESKFLTISSAIGKSFYLVAVLFFLKDENDYVLVPIYNFIAYFITFIIASVIIYKKYDVKYEFTSFSAFKSHLRMGKYMFLSEVKLFFISYFNIFILGILSGNTAVAYFVGAEKILRAVSNIFVPVQNSLFPVLAIKLNTNIGEGIALIKKIVLASFIIISILSVLLLLSSEYIVDIILGSKMKNSVIVFKILAFIPLLSFFDSFFGKQVLLNLRKEKEFFRVVLFAALINIPLIYILSLKYSYIGASISQMISQVILLVGMGYYSYQALKNKNI
ncbi:MULTISPECIES: flippase [Flavobacterium]|uniref:flippase n=1 Tax=Flavobacterium TaxID=237 RepID=UPI001FCAEA17|nr:MULTISPECIES: flippase [Flavobacterium]UOK43162.1 flippase [Flavobacterium enshiense]